MEMAKRRPGRPKGSRNKKANLSGATVEKICEYHAFNPASKLIAIANGEDEGDWSQDHRMQATTKLFDAIHNNKKLPHGAVDGGGDTQYEIVFLESGADGFTLPGETDAAEPEGTMQQESV